MTSSSPVLDFRTTNTLWCSILVETLYRMGLTTAVMCPGSRSTPLTLAFVQHPAIDAVPILDERSAAFFALGIARRSHQAVVLVCTSGTAGANFYPAVIEAYESRVPLVVLTADRPPELRACNSGQTIDQQKLYGTVPNCYMELPLPSLDPSMLAYVRQTLVHAWERSHAPVPGPVHLNVPFRDPLAPLAQPDAQALAHTFDGDRFFAHLSTPPSPPRSIAPSLHLPLSTWQSIPRGIIIAGIAQPVNPEGYCRAIAQLSTTLGWPVLAEGLSPVRNYASLTPYLVSAYDTLLRSPEHANVLIPDGVIRLGEMPTSKVLRQWLVQVDPLQWVIDAGDRNLDPTHGRTQHLRLTVEQLASVLPIRSSTESPVIESLPIESPIERSTGEAESPSPYLARWLEAERTTRHHIDSHLSADDLWFEGKIAWTVSQVLPPGTPLFIANSTPVRDVEWFWKPGDRHIQPFVNRGANGIDGTLSTALGIAHHYRSSVLLTGDLAFLHDTNGLLSTKALNGHLTVILINNNGGGIFEFLPIAQFEPPFEDYFATPQSVDIAALCAAYGVAHTVIQSWDGLNEQVSQLPERGVRVLELQCDRRSSFQYRQWLWSHFLDGR
jgi:2-succinyl-5-enolpyruvyl-6-hydroxy-3-cyclohexene-1-carboxylate synthase